MEGAVTESKESTELKDEFQKLGENLVENLKALWEHPETEEIRSEFKQGLHQLGDTINQMANDFSESPTGQKLQADAKDFGEKVRSGEVESRVRDELLRALSTINAELTKVQEKWSESGDQETE
jgi:uncharacterized protein YukE